MSVVPFDPKARLKRPKKIAGPSEPYDLDEMNSEFAIVMAGSKTLVMRERNGAGVGQRISLMKPFDFRQWLSHRAIYRTNTRGQTQRVSIADVWLEDRNRRQYDGLVFSPGAGRVVGSSYNLWTGWAVEPAHGGDCSPWFEHVREVICGGSPELERYVLSWCADMVQNPAKKPGVALVLRGGEGAGKTLFGQILGRLCPEHYFLIDSARYLTGQFNAHLGSCLLVQADEAFWAGDMASEGRLKGLVTSDFQMIEMKGVDPLRVENYIRLLASSNSDWVVPAGLDARRWAVIDVVNTRAGDRAWFTRLGAMLDDPAALAALLAELMAYPIADFDLRNVPKTTALLEQKIRSLDPIRSWWLGCLQRGAIDPKGQIWEPRLTNDDIYGSYLADAEQVRITRRSDRTSFGIAMRKLLPWTNLVKVVSPTNQRRLNGLEIPPLQDCRAFFETAIRQSVSWDDATAEGGAGETSNEGYS
jgi:hypothetical protein